MRATTYSRGGPTLPVLPTMAVLGGAIGLSTALSSPASASGRSPFGAVATSSSSGAGLVALGGAVLLLGGVGFVIFTWTRRKRRPNQCAEQREALELAERSVRYWEAARAHLQAVELQRSPLDGTVRDEPAHASLVAKAAEGLDAATKQRDERQMELIRCMASGGTVPMVPSVHSEPFFTPGPDGTSPSTAPNPTEG